MHIRPFSDILPRIPEVGQIRLKGIMKRSMRGFDKDLRSPLYDARPRDEIVDIFRQIGSFGHPEVDEMDEHEIGKIGTSSIQLPWNEVRTTLFEYFNNNNPSGDRSCFEKARRYILNLLPFRSLRSVPLEHAYMKMPSGTNLGAPLWSTSKEDAKYYLERARNIRSADEILPFTAFRRVQPNGTNRPKNRHVMGSDHVDTILWESLLIPLLDVLRNKPGFRAWSTQDDIDTSIHEVLLHATRNGRKITSGDHTGFDQHLSANIINVVFDGLESWFVESDSRIINILREEFLTTGILCPEGWIDGRYGSVMSGTGGTNLVDSLGNHFANRYVAERTETRLERCEVMGDDFVSIWSRDVTEVLEDVMSEIGLETNQDKQFISLRSCHFLQRWHSIDYQPDGVCRGVRSPFRALNGMMSYERLRSGWNEYMDSTRWIMQAEQVRWDKRFRHFVALMKQGDRVLRSGIDPVEIFELAGGFAKIRKVLGIQSFPFNTKRPEGVSSFATTQVLRAI